MVARDRVDLRGLYADSNVGEILDLVDRDLVALQPVKRRIREIAALLLVERARRQLGLPSSPPGLHMSFTGNPGTGKTTVAMRMAQILLRLGYVKRGHVVAVGRDDLVGQYVGHTAPKTREALKRAAGGVLFIDEAYHLYRPENDRDYGQEAIEILLQAMEAQREEVVVILAGYRDRMERFFQCNPGMSSRVAHHVEFPDYSHEELLAIADRQIGTLEYRLAPAARVALSEYVARRMRQPRFANAGSVRNAIDRARLRQASRLLDAPPEGVTRERLVTLEAEDFLQSRVFTLETEATP